MITKWVWIYAVFYGEEGFIQNILSAIKNNTKPVPERAGCGNYRKHRNNQGLASVDKS